MSVVWRAHDLVLDRDVAVKVLVPVTEGAPPEAIGNILAEAKAAARLNHPHIANVFDYGEAADEDGQPTPFVVMELLQGEPLSAVVAAGPADPAWLLRICAEVAEALAAAHAAGLVHRDVKPANVMVTASGAKIFDFGIAATVGTEDPSHPVVGTISYLAPERLSGRPVAAAADIYALGLTIYRVLTGERPWTASTPVELMNAHLFEEPAGLPELPGVPAEVAELYLRCVAKDPADRPSARSVAIALADAATRAESIPTAVASAVVDPPTRIMPALLVQAVAPAHPFAHRLTVGWGHERLQRLGRTGRTLLAAATATMFILAALVIGVALRMGPLGSVAAEGAFESGPTPGQPTGVAQTPATPEPQTVVAQSRTFTSEGGNLTVHCGPDQRVTLDGYQAAPGYTTKGIKRGPAPTVTVTFKQKGDEVSMTVRCPTDAPELTTWGKD